ncbi:MAG: DUF6586 family protein [Halioglobus sp.]
MTAARGNANQSLYLAKIVLDAWAAAKATQEIAEAVLEQAFLPGVREHIITAYGWFLLESAGFDDWRDAPPTSVTGLPSVAEGKATSGELREFQLLEDEGWLQNLLAEIDFSRPTPSPRSRASRNNLALAASTVPSLEDARAWHMQLTALIERMRDSFDEY